MNRRFFLKSLSAFGAISFVCPENVFAYTSDFNGAWTERKRPLMGGFVSVAVFSTDLQVAEKQIDRCFNFMEQEIALISEWQGASRISKLNRGEPLSILDSSGTVTALLHAIESSSVISRGAYALLPFALTSLWREARAAGAVPDKRDVTYALRRVKQATLRRENSEWRLYGSSGIDTGGVGEGFIAQRGCEFLKSQGVRYARIDGGGDISFLGDTRWRVELEDPRTEKLLGSVTLQGNAAIATSGDYRNCWFVNGKRYHHLVDPTTGFPTRHAQQITVIHPNAALADGLATGLSAFPASQAIALLERLPRAMGIIVDPNNEIHVTRGATFSRFI